MTKQVRIENADNNSAFKVVVEVWDKGVNGAPDVKAFERRLDYPTALANDIYLTSTRYFIVREVE